MESKPVHQEAVTFALKCEGIDDDRRLNAERFEEVFYGGNKENETVTPTEPETPPQSDQELLLSLLQKPGVAELLKTLAKTL